MRYSIIEWFGYSNSSSKCGYCKTFNGKHKHGQFIETIFNTLNRLPFLLFGMVTVDMISKEFTKFGYFKFEFL